MMQDNMEADDLIGIMCTQAPKTTIALSGDKDFATLPITWYNFLRDELVTLTKEEANKNHLIQTLMGDATDGYQGLKGVGPKTAVKLLDKHGWDWEAIVKIYESKDMTEEDALLTARLAYILRTENFKDGKIILWQPPTK
jgi:DNA polymerase-1